MLRAELARPGTRALPDGFPRPRLPPALRETIAAAADLADPSALADFYCERMPRMLVDQLVYTEAGEVHETEMLRSFFRHAGLREVRAQPLRCAPDAVLVRGTAP